MRPNRDEMPPSPPKNPWPVSMPNRPAPSSPAARPDPNPKRRGCPKPLPKAPPPTPGLKASGRPNGWAPRGAVLVEGGMLNERLPRDPKLKPPPARASATDRPAGTASSSASATAATFVTVPLRRERENVFIGPT